MNLLKTLFTKRTTLTKEDKDSILRALELRIEKLTPDFKDANETRTFHNNPPADFKATRIAFDKIYNIKHNAKISN